ncbi:MAG: large-conductance mechanosensitive channel protein MscL [Flavobacteriales bacterium]|nr:large-conductance mechanosensitive channel protein MscL [Flavobacteriales bacterium]MCB9197991.1 large-conductance mechanosensitive channel protein MscL [Flavobacteriales bacterium]
MSKFIDEFKAFAMKGNVIDLAVAVVIGGAFSAIVKALVDNIIMPVLGMVIGDSFASLSVEVNGVHLAYGQFLQSVVNFVLIALVLFMVIKGMNATKKKKEEAPAAPPAPSKEETLLTEIRDLLKNK